MSKSSIICEACGENNIPNSEFCVGCGSKISVITTKAIGEKTDVSDEEEEEEEEESYEVQRAKYFKSLPTLFAVIIFLFFIDYVDGTGNIEWAYFPGVAIFLFAIAAPYFNFRREPANIK